MFTFSIYEVLETEYLSQGALRGGAEGGGHYREECGVNTWPKKLTMELISNLSADWSTDVLGTIKRGELFKDTE